MQIGKLKIAMGLLCCVALAFEVWHFRNAPKSAGQQSSPVAGKNKPDFVLLPATEIVTLSDLFGDPKPHFESWEPTMGDIDDIEDDLPEISVLSTKLADPNRRIDNPHQYFRQYLAVVMNGKRTIFVNALCSIDRPETQNQWRKRLLFGNDGGKCYWQTMYDVSTRRFSNLMVNGVG